MSAEIHSVLISVGERMLVLPAQSLTAVVSPQGMKRLPQMQAELLGTVESAHGVLPVLDGQAMVGAPSQALNNRCRLAVLRAPGMRESFAVLARAYPLVVSLTDAAFRPVPTTASLPESGFLGYGMVGRRTVYLPDLSWWAGHAASLLTATEFAPGGGLSA